MELATKLAAIPASLYLRQKVHQRSAFRLISYSAPPRLFHLLTEKNGYLDSILLALPL